MVTLFEALKIIIASADLFPKETVLIENSLNRILGEDVVSDTDMPPFNKSAMDGFACRREDLGNNLEIIETIRAGDLPKKAVGKNQCTKIMTGGKVPSGANCVIMVEYTQQVFENVIRFTAAKTADNIALQAEDIKKGEIVLKAGTKIHPQQIAVLASVGCVNPVVYRQPKVAVLSTGNEIVEPHIKPQGAAIRNSNGIQLVNQLLKLGINANYLGIVGDTIRETDMAIKQAFSINDLVIFTGGVSKGDYDYVPGVLKENGVEILFEEVAVKPGRPTVFGRKGKQFVFGLPGNPVSSFIIFELIVKPFIYSLMGYNYKPLQIKVPIGEDYSRKKADRISWTPVIVDNDLAIPVDYHGSAHIHSLCFANGLLAMDVGIAEFKKGDLVNVRLFQ